MFIELAKKRRSIKKFTSQQVEQEKVDAIIEAALRAPSGRGTRPWELVFVKDKGLLEKLSVAKPGGAAFVKDASLGIVVCGDPSKSGLWLEDCAIAAVSMQYAAHSMGLGSRWAHIRENNYNDGKSSRDYIAELIDLPDNLDVECIIAIGYPGEEIVPYRKEDLAFDKISYHSYGPGPIPSPEF
ncbi:MAG: nitroreductase family protein [Desulfatiglandales bacterium]|jgi:nitroreductase|nr:nitroreductase family protein [Desulfatiglandales bacterium]